MLLSGRVFKDDGTGINGATATIYPANSDTPISGGSITTANDSHGKAGYWEKTDVPAGVYKVKIEYGLHVKWLHGESGVQFEEVNVGEAIRLTDDGNVVLSNPTDPTDGASVDSPSITLTGAFDSNAGVGVITRSDRSMSIVNDVADAGTYKLSIRDNAASEVASISSAGVVTGTGLKVGSDLVGPSKADVQNESAVADSVEISGDYTIISQELTLAARSQVVVVGNFCWSAATNCSVQGKVLADSTVLGLCQFKGGVGDEILITPVVGGALLDAGTYTFKLNANLIQGAAHIHLFKSSAAHNYLHVFVTSTAS